MIMTKSFTRWVADITRMVKSSLQYEYEQYERYNDIMVRFKLNFIEVAMMLSTSITTNNQ